MDGCGPVHKVCHSCQSKFVMVRLWLGFKSWAGQHHKQDILNEAKEYQQLVSFIYYEKAEALQISTPALRSVDCQASFCTELNRSLKQLFGFSSPQNGASKALEKSCIGINLKAPKALHGGCIQFKCRGPMACHGQTLVIC